MGLILDSSAVIAAERRGETVEQLIQRVLEATGDQEVALSAVGLTELVHGIYRADTAERRAALTAQGFPEPWGLWWRDRHKVGLIVAPNARHAGALRAVRRDSCRCGMEQKVGPL